jgi:hypothetical protein
MLYVPFFCLRKQLFASLVRLTTRANPCVLYFFLCTPTGRFRSKPVQMACDDRQTNKQTITAASLRYIPRRPGPRPAPRGAR